MYVEKYQLLTVRNELIEKGYDEEDLDILLELHEKHIHKEDWSNNIE